MKWKSFILLNVVLNSILNTTQDAICTEEILITELMQDIKDNGKLDCLRVPIDIPKDHLETEEERIRRNEGMWDTDCAFEANYDWFSILKKNYNLHTTLVNRDGHSVNYDFPDQADMCEIVRALIFAGKFEGFTLDNITVQILDFINCPGDDSQTQVCAATGGSASQSYSWYIFLEGSSIQVDDKPRWKNKNEVLKPDL